MNGDVFYKDTQQAEGEGEEGECEDLFREDIQLGDARRKASQQVPSEGWQVQKSCGSNMLGCQGPAANKPVVTEESEQEGR